MKTTMQRDTSDTLQLQMIISTTVFGSYKSDKNYTDRLALRVHMRSCIFDRIGDGEGLIGSFFNSNCGIICFIICSTTYGSGFAIWILRYTKVIYI